MGGKIKKDATAQIRDRAHALWEQEGYPDGRAVEHWLTAEALVTQEANGSVPGTARRTPRAPAKSKAASAKSKEAPAKSTAARAKSKPAAAKSTAASAKAPPSKASTRKAAKKATTSRRDRT